MGNFISNNSSVPETIRGSQAIIKKAKDALQHANRAGGLNEPKGDEGRRIKGDHGEVMDICWHKDINEVVVAFHIPPDRATHEDDLSVQPKCLARVRQLKIKEGVPKVAPELTKLLDEFLGERGLTELMATAGDIKPRRIVCTGFGLGGSIAAITAVLLAVEYPGADMRCVTVDSPVFTYGNAAFASLYNYLVGFSYHINTGCLLSLLPDMESFPLNGQFLFQASQKPVVVVCKPTDATPGNWSEETIQQLLTNSHVARTRSRGSSLAPPTPKVPALDQKQEVDMCDATCAATRTSETMKQTLSRLFNNDPAGKEVSLSWTDGDVKGPFSNLDTIEKILLVGKKIASLAGMAAAAYLDIEGFRKLTQVGDACIFINRNGRRPSGRPQKGGKCYVVWRPKINTLVVAFRGTTTKADTKINLKAVHRSASFLSSIVNGASVHRGFYQQLDDMWPSIKKGIADLRAQPGMYASIERVVVTGHSLGSALATLGGPRLALEYPMADVQVISWASPRVGNKEFMLAFNTLTSTSLRFQYNYDPVPCLPMAYLGGFKHVKFNVYLRPTVAKDGIDEDAVMDLHADPPHSPMQCFLNVGHLVVANHSMSERYIGALVGYMQRLGQDEAREA